MSTPLTIGAFGLGCVGQGFLQLLDGHGGTAAHVKHICVKERGRERNTYRSRLTYNALDILTDNDVRAIVELTNDPGLAIEVIRHALNTDRNAITASKKVVAEHLAELIALQRATGRSLLYEASCAASIPVLNALETHFSGERVLRIEGILNGTSNYILTRASEDGSSLQGALARAQELGFAETNATSDLSGDDACYKLTILIAHAFGTVVKPHEVPRFGIGHLDEADIAYGRAQGWTVRSIATAYERDGRLIAHVLPAFVPVTGSFAHVRDEYNAVRITGEYTGEHLLQGKGAGRLPTGLAVLSDVQRLIRSRNAAGGGYTYAKVNADAPVLSRFGDRVRVYLRLPVTHQELLGRFDTVRTMGNTATSVQVEGLIQLDELVSLVGDGRDGFQVVQLPHLAA